MKKVKAVPFQSLFDINDNMYQNVIVISKRSREIVSENVLDLNKLEEGFETTDEIQEVPDFDPNQDTLFGYNVGLEMADNVVFILKGRKSYVKNEKSNGDFEYEPVKTTQFETQIIF